MLKQIGKAEACWKVMCGEKVPCMVGTSIINEDDWSTMAPDYLDKILGKMIFFTEVEDEPEPQIFSSTITIPTDDAPKGAFRKGDISYTDNKIKLVPYAEKPVGELD